MLTHALKQEIIKNYDLNLLDLSNNLNKYIEKTKDIGQDFGGPSIYFHNEAIGEISKGFLGKRHLDMIYAVLPAWGMHRMGKTYTKVVDYNHFIEEIMKQKDIIYGIKNKKIDETIIPIICNLLENIRVSVSDSYLVSSSKVLHHIIPNLICPIDRKYSINFLMYQKNTFKDTPQLKSEKELSEIFITGMYSFIKKHETILQNNVDNVFNTSVTKIFDNLIVAYGKSINE